MKGKLGVIYCVCVLMFTHFAYAETCVKTTFNVTYTCNGGTLAGTLPDDTTARYGSSFSPATITSDMCNAPSGYAYAGHAVIVDGEEVASNVESGGISFSYYYTSDIEIGPHWVPVADETVLANDLGIRGLSFTYDETAMTWSTVFPYGTVNGVAKCSSIKPENTSQGYFSGLIAIDQDALEGSAAGSGGYCYCKMTEPFIAASPWVFYYERGYACASSCANSCASTVSNHSAFRASVFAATGK